MTEHPTPTPIPRFDMVEKVRGMESWRELERDPTGEWCLYEDAQAEIERLQRIETRLDEAICLQLPIDPNGPGDCTDRLVAAVNAAGDEIERLQSEIAHRDELERFAAPLSCVSHGLVPNLALFGNKCPACERDRLRAALDQLMSLAGGQSRAGIHYEGCADRHPWCRAFCIAQRALSSNGRLLHETSAVPKRAYYETHEPPHCPTCECDRGPALCPHGFPLAENVCGPCSKGEPNRPPLKAGESHGTK